MFITWVEGKLRHEPNWGEIQQIKHILDNQWATEATSFLIKD